MTLSSAVAVTRISVPPPAAGVAELDAADSGPVPIAFVALILTVYGVPFVNPVMFKGDAGPVAVSPPGVAVAV